MFSLKEIVPFLLNHGFDYVLSERFCLDDLENYFGMQRSIHRRKDNQNVRDTHFNDNLIETQFNVKPIRGNVRPAENLTLIISDTPLKKTKTH